MLINLSDRQEDYLRGILELVEEKGPTKIRDISTHLGVSPASAVQMMRKLNEKKLVVYKKYGGVSLTPAGRNIAKAISLRHKTFRKFLEILLVPTHIAIKDAHILEHPLDPVTVIQFSRFVDFTTNPDQSLGSAPRWEEMFKRYCNEKGYSIGG
jgi:DtxR family Mn-dependent transcriptional regulator